MGFPDTVIVTSRIQHSNTDNAESSAIFQQLHRDGMGFPGGRVVKNLPVIQETWVRTLGWDDPLKEGMATHSRILAWRILMDRGAWQATVHGVTKSQTRLSD